MQINQAREEGTLTISLEGRLDTVTAPELEKETKDLAGVKKLILDLDKLEYISSAGLRVVLMLQKRMKKQGGMAVRNVNEMVMEVFEMTGFADILSIEA